jgi:hypothetical protein
LLARCSHRSRSRPVPTASQVVKASLPSSSRMSSSWEAPDMSCRTRACGSAALVAIGRHYATKRSFTSSRANSTPTAHGQ